MISIHATILPIIHGLHGLMKGGGKLYESIGRDICFPRLNLNRKLDFLRKSFDIFMHRIILSVITFVVCHLFFGDLAVWPLFQKPPGRHQEQAEVPDEGIF